MSITALKAQLSISSRQFLNTKHQFNKKKEMKGMKIKTFSRISSYEYSRMPGGFRIQQLARGNQNVYVEIIQ